MCCVAHCFVVGMSFSAYDSTSIYKSSNVLQAWQEDALDTVKLIAHLRDVRDGKGDKKQFQTCVQWLAKHQTATLVKNLPEIVKVCRFTKIRP